MLLYSGVVKVMNVYSVRTDTPSASGDLERRGVNNLTSLALYGGL